MPAFAPNSPSTVAILSLSPQAGLSRPATVALSDDAKRLRDLAPGGASEQHMHKTSYRTVMGIPVEAASLEVTIDAAMVKMRCGDSFSSLVK